MGVITRYDEMRDDLKDDLKECLQKAKELVAGDDIWGYDEFPDDYAMNVYLAIKKAIDSI